MYRHRLAHFSVLLLAPALFSTGCPRSPEAAGPPPTREEIPELRNEVDTVRAEAEALHRSRARILWRTLLAGEPADLSRVHADHRDIFSEDAWRSVARLGLGDVDPSEKRALELLDSYLLAEHLASKVSKLDEEISRIETVSTVQIEGHTIPYRDVGRLLANESDPFRRRSIHEASLQVVDRLTPLSIKRQAELASATEDLGLESPLAAGARMRGVDLDEVEELARRTLALTEESYLEALALVAHEELGLGLEHLAWADLPHIFRSGEELSDHLQADLLVAHLRDLLEGMGLSLDAGGRIEIASLDADVPAPPAVCVPVVIPSDVRLALSPVGGLHGYRAALNEMGHAQALAAVVEGSFEARHLGDTAVREALALVFESFLLDHLRLAEATGLSTDDVVRATRALALERVFSARRQAAKLLFQIELSTAEEEDYGSPETLYARLMEEAYGFDLGMVDRARWALDLDYSLRSAHQLRALVLEAQLVEHLRESHGDRWWEDPRTGAWMEDVWAAGGMLTEGDLTDRISAGSLEPNALARRLATAWKPRGP